MAKSTHDSGTFDVLKTVRGESVNYGQFFDHLREAMQITEGAVITTLPRGSLQIAQPPRISEVLLRSYSKDFHAFDRPSWTAILKRKAVRAGDSWSSAQEYESSRYRREFLAPNGLQYAAAAPLAAPVLGGYPGALTVYRTAEQGRFTDAELAQLGEFAKQLDAAIERARGTRKPKSSGSGAGAPAALLRPQMRGRQFIFDAHARPRVGEDDLSRLDDRLRQGMVQHVQQRIAQLNGKAVAGDRVTLPDSHGDLWVFRVVVHRQYPALGDGPFVFFCLQPDTIDWGTLRPGDFQADSELARLIPALKFMEQEFHRGPTLGEIARTVHLSPFHFHRRFTELLGITPKHFLLDCQIAQAKRELISGEKELAEIATACGFAHQSHFTSRFKQATGLTPTRWRRLAREQKGSSKN
jgi:AraC-like DNA-binding protein